MASTTVRLSNVPGTEAAIGWVGSHTVIADRPVGRAGGLGLGLNGAELLALSIGGCFCNDLRYAAHECGIPIDTISVQVTVNLDGEPIIATSAEMRVQLTTGDGSDPAVIVEHAKATCMVSNSISRGVPVSISLSD